MITALLLMPAVLLALYMWHRHELWVHYLAVMNLYRVREAGRLPDEIENGFEGRSVLGWGLWLDVSYNLVWATIEFRGCPRELLFTSRLERYKYGKTKRVVIVKDPDAKFYLRFRLRLVSVTVPTATGKRLALTNHYCDKLLDPYDPHPSGLHVRP